MRFAGALAGPKIYKLIVAGAFALVLMGCTPPPANEFFTVDTTDDTIDAAVGDGVCADAAGNCSLRAAVMEGNADPNTTEIVLSPGTTYTLTLAGVDEDGAATGDLDLNERTYIRSYATTVAETATIDAAGLDRAIEALAGDFHFLEGLTITGGDTIQSSNSDGGAIRHAAGLLGIEDTMVVNNSAGAKGGGIASVGGTLWIEDSLIANNTVVSFGSGIFTGTTSRLFQTTVADNSGGVGAVSIEATNPTGADVDILWSTITAGSGIALDVFSGTAVIEHSIVEAPSNCEVGPNGSFSSTRSIYSDSSCPAGTGDVQNTDTALTAVGDYGGPTRTRQPTNGSAAIDATPVGTGDCVATLPADARGQARPQGGCDAGAVETQPSSTPGADCLPGSVTSGSTQFRNCDLSNANIVAESFLFADFTGANLTNANLDSSLFNDTTFLGANLTGANLGGVSLSNVGFLGVIDDGIRSGGITGSASALPGDAQIVSGYWIAPNANLTDATITATAITDANLAGANLTNANLGGSLLLDANLTGAILVGTNLDGTHLTGANLTGADLTNANLANASIGNANFTDVNSTYLASGGLTGTPSALPGDVQIASGYWIAPNANLTDATINAAAISDANLAGANLTNANLGGSLLPDANLTGAILVGTNLDGTHLTGANLTGATLVGAIIDATALANANLTDATLLGAVGTPAVSGTIFGDTTCPTGVTSTANGGTCDGQYLP